MSKYIVTASALHVRSGPGTTFSIIGTLVKNNIVQGNEILSRRQPKRRGLVFGVSQEVCDEL